MGQRGRGGLSDSEGPGLSVRTYGRLGADEGSGSGSVGGSGPEAPVEDQVPWRVRSHGGL